jgi:transcriptional regulator with XRE-family HTH domain
MGETETQKKAIADRLRMAREHAGLSQTQVAKLHNVHRPTISEIEAGRRNVTAEELTSFANTYDVSVSWLLGEESGSRDKTMDRVELAARELSKLKPEDLDQLIQLLQAMRKSGE